MDDCDLKRSSSNRAVKADFDNSYRKVKKNTALFSASCILNNFNQATEKMEEIGIVNIKLVKNGQTGAISLSVKSPDYCIDKNVNLNHLISSQMQIKEESSTRFSWKVNFYKSNQLNHFEAKIFLAKFKTLHDARQFKIEFKKAVLDSKLMNNKYAGASSIDLNDHLVKINILPFNFSEFINEAHLKLNNLNEDSSELTAETISLTSKIFIKSKNIIANLA